MKPYFQHAGTAIYHGDCREVLPQLEKVEFILSDPPYGIGYDPEIKRMKGHQDLGKVKGDDVPFDPTHLMGFPDVLLWGCNNYCSFIPNGIGQWYFWDKRLKNGLGVASSEGEFAWHKLGTKPRAFRHLWSGAYKASESGARSRHPTQKPVALMRWCFQQSKKTGLVVDPYMGSGSTLCAAVELGRAAIGIDVEERWCELAAKRIQGRSAGFGLLKNSAVAPSTSNGKDLFGR